MNWIKFHVNNRNTILLALILVLMSLMVACGGTQRSSKPLLTRLWELANANYESRDYQRAALCYWEVLKRDKYRRYDDLYSFLADSYLNMGKLDSARMVYEMGIRVYPSKSELYGGLGSIYYINQHLEKAILQYERAVALNPENLDQLRRLADLYLRTDRLVDAIWVYEKIAALDSTNAEAREIVKELKRRWQVSDNRVEHTRNAWEKDPKDAQKLYSLAKSYRLSGAFEKAIEFFLKLLTLSPNEFRSHLELAKIYLEKGEFRKARDHAFTASNSRALYGEANLLLGKIYERAVAFCQNETRRDTVNYYDKLVYTKAHYHYSVAEDSEKLRDEAAKARESIVPFLPTEFERFIYAERQLSDVLCYIWIDAPELANNL